jgi:hypothetical protein
MSVARKHHTPKSEKLSIEILERDTRKRYSKEILETERAQLSAIAGSFVSARST